MKSVIKELKHWTKCSAVLLQSPEPMTIRIMLKDGSIGQPYLIIEKDEDDFCRVPINRLIELSFNTKQIKIILSEYDDSVIVLHILESRDLEIFVSQFRLCCNISRNSFDDFKEQNFDFIQRIKIDPSLIEGAEFYDVFGTYCGISPVSIDNEAKKTWIERLNFLNSCVWIEALPLSVTAVTWNLAGGKPNKSVADELKKAVVDNPDIVFFNFQEIDMSMKSVVSGTSPLANEWADIINNIVRESGSSLVVKSKQSLGGVFAAIAVNTNSKVQIEVTGNHNVRLGAHGLGANKAALMFNVSAGMARFSFVGCHLVPHDKNWEERNQQLQQILEMVPEKTDYLVLMGDLNYRVNMSYEDCLSFLNKGDITPPLKVDQLRLTLNDKPDLGVLKEAPITFMPTYKFDPNSNVYDTSHKHRVPSYTDRALVRTYQPRMAIGPFKSYVFESDVYHHFTGQHKPQSIITSSYFSLEEPQMNFPSTPTNVYYNCGLNTFSDHRAVHSRWQFNVPYHNREKEFEFKNLLIRKLDEMSYIMKPELLAEPSSCSLSVGGKAIIKAHNVSLAWARWKSQVIGSGIKVTPQDGITIPGKETIIELEVTKFTEEKVVVTFNSEHGTLFHVDVSVEKQSFLKSLFHF